MMRSREREAQDPDDPRGAPPADLERIARWMDEAFPVPGTRYRVGWDGILGLVPGAGDLLATLPALWIVLRSLDLGVSYAVAARMLGNILLENIVGSVPLLGDVFDFAWKANRRNLRLLQRYQRNPSATGLRSAAGLGVLAVVLLALAAALVAIPVLLLIWLAETIGAAA